MSLIPEYASFQARFETPNEDVPSLDLQSALAFRAATTALELGFFRALAAEARKATQVAERCRTDVRASGILLEVLENLGYVSRQDDAYSLTPMARRWMLPPEDGFDFTQVQRYWSLQLFQLWDSLETTLRTGRSGLNLYRWLDERPAAQRIFQEMLGHLAELNAPEILAALALGPERRHEPLRLLDLGAGHGRFALAFLQELPEANAVLTDSATAMAIARENAEAVGVGGRCETLVLDLLQDPLPGDFDVVFLFSMVHNFDADTNRALLRRIYAAMKDGAILAVLEQLADEVDPNLPRVAAAYHQVFRLNLFHLLGGYTYTSSEIQGFFAEAGLTFDRKIQLEATGDVLLLAHR